MGNYRDMIALRSEFEGGHVDAVEYEKRVDEIIGSKGELLGRAFVCELDRSLMLSTDPNDVRLCISMVDVNIKKASEVLREKYVDKIDHESIVITDSHGDCFAKDRVAIFLNAYHFNDNN